MAAIPREVIHLQRDVAERMEFRCQHSAPPALARTADSTRRPVSTRKEPVHAIEIPLFDDLVLASGRSAPEMERELIVLLAVKLFELHRVSLGQAAEIAGESKWSFTETLGRMGVAVIQWDEQQRGRSRKNSELPEDVVVADSSVLILLARVGRLGLLQSLFHHIIVHSRV